MSTTSHEPRGSVSATDAPRADEGAATGLGVDELAAEQAADLPDREAMSILDVGNVGVGLPPPAYLDDVIDTPPPVVSQPVDGLPVEQYPIDGVPIDRLPIETLPIDEVPVQPLPSDPPVVGEPIGVPDADALPKEPGLLA